MFLTWHGLSLPPIRFAHLESMQPPKKFRNFLNADATKLMSLHISAELNKLKFFGWSRHWVFEPRMLSLPKWMPSKKMLPQVFFGKTPPGVAQDRFRWRFVLGKTWVALFPYATGSSCLWVSLLSPSRRRASRSVNELQNNCVKVWLEGSQLKDKKSKYLLSIVLPNRSAKPSVGCAKPRE